MRKLLLHTCCAPCGTSVFETLINEKEYAITSFFYNPNIKPREEWEKRLCELEKLVDLMNGDVDIVGANCVRPKGELVAEGQTGERSSPLQLVVSEYDMGEFDNVACGMEHEPEGGARCQNCFHLRLHKTAEYAKTIGYDIFSTTLTASPHKNAELINKIGREISAELGIEYLERDFKKNDGYKRSIELCKEMKIYRQNYCGCTMRGKK